MVRSHLERRGTINNRQAARSHFDDFLLTVQELEPSDDELTLASAIEEAAITLGLDLDGGESQLCAIAVFRSSPLLLTGDKRAIAGAEIAQGPVGALSALQGRIVCLEQAIMGIANRIGHHAVRSAICAEPHIDRTLSICFRCGRADSDLERSTYEGLVSYVNNLREHALTLLYADDAL